MIRIHLPLLGAAAGLFFTASPFSAQAASWLVKEGEVTGAIVTPAQPTKAEEFAAGELQDYIERITGQKVPIEASDSIRKGPAIVIGRHAFNAEALKKLNEKHGDSHDAFSVVSQGEALSLVGRSETATLWAAWSWLEHLGVRWLMPAPQGTFVPKKDAIDLEAVAITEKPGMIYRGPNYHVWGDPLTPEGLTARVKGIPANELFSLRMRMNDRLGFVPEDRISRLGAGHSYNRYLPTDRYGAEHPEWYNLVDGKRELGPTAQVCFTNSEAAAEMAKNMLAEIANELAQGVPEERIRMAVSPNDFAAMCTCPKCTPLIDPDGSSTSLVTHFANLVAAEIEKVYPKVMVYFYAYDNYSTLPAHAKPAKNVYPEVTAWTLAASFAVNNAKPLFSPANAKFEREYRGWEKISPGLSAYMYYGHYIWFTPWPMVTQMARDLPMMAENPKFLGTYSESHLHWGTQGLNFWLHPKLMWNPKLDVPAAIRDYCEASFGPGADLMERYFQTLQKSMDAQGYIVGGAVEIPQVLTPAVIASCNESIDGLENLLGEMDEDMQWRSQLVISAWRASVKFTEAIRISLGVHPGDSKRVLALCNEVDEYAKSDLGRWAFEYRMFSPALESIRSGVSPALNALPTGESKYSANLEEGGALHLFAKASGWNIGRWGYGLGAKAKGRIELPLKAEEGRRITKANVGFGIKAPERLSGSLYVMHGKGQKRLISDSLSAISQGVEIPTDLLGSEVQLKLEVVNQSQDIGTVVTNYKVEATVE